MCNVLSSDSDRDNFILTNVLIINMKQHVQNNFLFRDTTHWGFYRRT